jgi:hypothetical protein
MIHEIAVFKTRILESTDDTVVMDYMSAVANFGDYVNRAFRETFPTLDPAEYWATGEWHSLIGSTLPKNIKLTTNIEVVAWLRGAIGHFLYLQNKELFGQ